MDYFGKRFCIFEKDVLAWWYEENKNTHIYIYL